MRISLVLVFILNSALAIAQEAEFKFVDTKLKLPKTEEGKVLEFEYTFENKGDAPLIISKIEVACTCTKFTYPTLPVKPGESGTIKVTFDSEGKTGWQYRDLIVYSNAKKNPEKLRFIVEIINEVPKESP